MTHGSLFSGIGGFDLAAEWMGWENVFHCEWNEFGKKVLHHYWPQSISYHDITKTDFTIHRGTIDILTGGFPCQPYSSAGKRKGKEDERHLWPEMLRAIREIQPRWVVGENVLGLVNWSGGLVFHEVQADLEAAGYEVWPYVLPACAANGQQLRNRIYFIAHSNKMAGQSMGKCKNETTKQWNEKIGSKNREFFHMAFNGNMAKVWNGEGQFLFSEPTLVSNINGFSSQLDRITFSKWCNESNGGFGNAIAPPVVYQIFKAIQQYETTPSLEDKI